MEDKHGSLSHEGHKDRSEMQKMSAVYRVVISWTFSLMDQRTCCASESAKGSGFRMPTSGHGLFQTVWRWASASRQLF